MIKQGLNKISPNRKDFSLLHSFGALDFDTKGLPATFSIFDGRVIPNQNELDERFSPASRPLPEGCTAETTTFIAGLEDGATYLPDAFYFATPPGTDNTGRDIRTALQTSIDIGFRSDRINPPGNKRTAYFNCYGSGKIDDYDATKIGIWINQQEKRGVSVGSWWYWGIFAKGDGILPSPSFDISQATLHNWLVTGWVTIADVEYLECIPWCGMDSGNNGIVYISRVIFNALMGQPYTGAFTLTKVSSVTPIPIGYQAIIDHLVYFIRNLFGV